MISRYRKCDHCKQLMIGGCRGEFHTSIFFHRYFCNEKCYLEYCKEHDYIPYPEKLKYTKGY